MLACFTTDAGTTTPIHVQSPATLDGWLSGRPAQERAWIEASGFRAKAGAAMLLPGPDGAIAGVLAITGAPASPFDLAGLPKLLPGGDYRLDDLSDDALAAATVLGFGLGSYRFDRYRRVEDDARSRLLLPDGPAARRASVLARAVAEARDLVNTPANDMGPEELATAFTDLAHDIGADIEITTGDDLLDAGYPLVLAVGRASVRAPRLIDLTWGDPSAPRVTLVGKGVCFDTGGLDIKPPSNMLLMKKDMAGAAVVFGLARAIALLALPVRLRVLVPAVENSISGGAFRPGDVLTSRKGLTVEIGNTDAEGRLVLADALAAADAEGPALLIDLATLTGAARVAVGPDLPALFTADDALATDLRAIGQAEFDPVWRLPLHAPYRELLKTPMADISSTGSSGFAGACTAALFLQEFVGKDRLWAHFDIYGHNPSDRPGRPKGGEASALRAVFGLIERRFGEDGAR